MRTLKQLREERNLRQVDIAAVLGVAPPLISVYENAHTNPPLRDMILLENHFAEPIAWPDTITAYDRQEIMHNLMMLAEHYPLSTILDYAVKSLKTDEDLRNAPGTLIRNAVFMAAEADAPLPPTGIELDEDKD